MKTLKARKTAKDERRNRRKQKSRRRPDGLRLHPLGGTFEPGLAESILAAFDAFDPTAPWADVAPRIVPVLKRVHHPFPPEMAPIHIRVPPGIWTGFGIDLGPAFSHVSQALLDRWGIDHATLLGTALANLTDLVRQEQPIVDAVPVDGVEDGLAVDLWQAIAQGAHDELDVEPLRWTGSTVASIGDGTQGLPN
jgi:hypothetical protein